MRSSGVAVATAFVVNGTLYGSWAARVPALADQVGAGVEGVGLALLGPAVAMILTAGPAARACARWGARPVLAVCLTGACLLLPLLGLTGSVWTLGLALAALGGLMGAVDVSMNIAAVAVIRTVNRPLMPVFHAGFSFGGLAGSAGAAGAAALALTPSAQFAAVAAVTLAALALTVGATPAQAAEREEPAPGGRSPGGYPRVPTRGRLWLLAAVALCAAVAEGACAEWSALFLTDARAVGEAAAAAGYSVFAVAIAVTRLTGEWAQRRFGPYRLLMTSGGLAAAGVLLAAAVPSGAAGYIGFAIAGAGLAFCFPLAMDLAGAAGREPGGTGGCREVGFVTTVAYAGLLGCPPMIGAVAGAGGLAVAMGVVGAVALLIVPVAIACRPRPAGRPAVLAEAERS